MGLDGQTADAAVVGRQGQDGDRVPRPGTFDFPGFTHYWCTARNGSWVLKRKTAEDRLRRSLTAINRWCAVHRHAAVAEQIGGWCGSYVGTVPTTG